LIVIVLISLPLRAQTKIDSTASNKQDTVKFVMQKSATGAMLRSMVLPGWGQFYNESYWKVPVVWGFFGYFIYKAIDYQNTVNLWQDKYNANPINDYKNVLNQAKDNRDIYWVYAALTYFINIVDAYVDAHLFDFDVSETNKTMNYSIKLKIGL